MDRRSFMKLGGTAVAAGLTGGCGQVTQKIIPYVIPPDDDINPVEGWYYFTTCRMCNAGCGIMVRTIEGRAKKVEGNLNHPVNRGGVCARGQAAVQQLYHPERLRQPLMRTGPKGSNSFKPVSWDKALGLLAERMKKARGKGVYVITDEPSDITAAITKRVLEKLGSNNFVAPDISGRETHFAVSSLFTGRPALPYCDISQASCTLLLGADIFEDGFSPVHYGWAYGEMRRGNPTRRGRIIYAGSRVSMTAASADHFIAANKGTLGILALGVAHEILKIAEEKGFLKDIPVFTKTNWIKTAKGEAPEKISERTSVSINDIRMIAEELIKHEPSTVIPGEDVASHSNGFHSLKAVEFLNSILREINRQKQSHGFMEPPQKDRELYDQMKNFIGVPEKARAYSTLQQVMARAADGKMELGIIIHSNPVHGTPVSIKADEALSRTGFVAAFGCFLNDTTRYADLILPDNHFLESWSLQVVDYPQGAPVLNIQQPVVEPLYETMQTGDAILKAASMAGVDIGVKSQEMMIEKMVGKFRSEWKGIPTEFREKKAWEFLLQKGGWWPEKKETYPDNVRPAAEKDRSPLPEIRVDDPTFSGKDAFPLHLHPYGTVNMANGSVTNLTWLLEMPEPMTTLSWGAWVEINPKTAQKHNITDGDVLKVESIYGSVEIPAYIYPGIGPDSVAIPFGYGHTSFGKHASNRGANVMELIGDFFVNGSDALAWRGIRVKIAKTGKNVKMVREGNPEGDYHGEVFQL